MKLSELIAKYGDDKVQFQNLDNSAIDLQYDAKTGTTIKFKTRCPLDMNGTKQLGLVVWFDRDEVKKIMGGNNE